MSRGRPAKGPKMVEDLDGSRDAKKRLKVILETISGDRGAAEACAELGIGKSAFHELRTKALQATLENLEPRPAGRPRKEVSEEQAEVERLEREKKELLTELEIAHVREEIMLAMPEVLEPAKEAAPKGTPMGAAPLRSAAANCAAEKKTMSGSEKKKKLEERRKKKKRREMRKRSKKR